MLSFTLGFHCSYRDCVFSALFPCSFPIQHSLLFNSPFICSFARSIFELYIRFVAARSRHRVGKRRGTRSAHRVCRQVISLSVAIEILSHSHSRNTVLDFHLYRPVYLRIVLGNILLPLLRYHRATHIVNAKLLYHRGLSKQHAHTHWMSRNNSIFRHTFSSSYPDSDSFQQI